MLWNGSKKWCRICGYILEELRQKDGAIQRDLLDGIDYADGEITVVEAVDDIIWNVPMKDAVYMALMRVMKAKTTPMPA